MKVKMNVLSLFDGISCARVALDRLGIDCKYYASEIDKYAIYISVKNYPDIIQIGDVKHVNADMFHEPIDLLIGGSPCQDLSLANANREGLNGSRSGLFWEYVRILREVNPKYFVLENVNSMSGANRDIISKALGVEPIMIDASLVSAQSRKRLFWTNIPHVNTPNDRCVYIMDILESNESEYFYLYKSGRKLKTYKLMNKSAPLFANPMSDFRPRVIKNGIWLNNKEGDCEPYKIQISDINEYSQYIRKITCIEGERLQSLPDNYTEGISKTQRFKCLGNAFNVEVIKHVLKFIKDGYSD